jgi:hypothetical protein
LVDSKQPSKSYISRSAINPNENSPTDQATYDEWQAASANVVKSWIENSSPPGIVEFVGQREIVQDYESIRHALGYEKINFLGGSRY